MHKIKFNNIKRDFPENISEMTAPQFRYFAYLEMLRQLGKITMAQLEVQFVYFALNMVRTSNAPLVVENITKLRQLVRPYYTTQSHKGKIVTILDLNFVKNPLPEITIVPSCLQEGCPPPADGVVLHGPADALQNCTYEEVFVHAQNALLDFSNTQNAESLNELVAILYRPAKKGKRPKFDPEKTNGHLELVKSLHEEIKFGVYLFFASCHKFITTATDLNIGGGTSVNIAELFKPDPTQGKSKGIGPVGIIYSLAESGVFGNAKETARQNVYDVLIRMVQLNEQAKKMKQDAKRK